MMQSLDDLERVLATLLRVLLWGSAAAVLFFGIMMIRDMDASSRSQGGVIYVAGAMVLVLGVIAGKLLGLSRRTRR